MMRNASSSLLTLLAAAVVGCAGVGCGDLSQEDLVFANAVPSKEQLALRPAGDDADPSADGANAQALDEQCADGDLKCHARNAARGFNTLTFGVLDLVDTVLRQPPTAREPGKRVWGPFFLADEGRTARFEMRRNADHPEEFDFCLHVAGGFVGAQKAKDVSCDVDADEASGMKIVLSGSLVPGSIPGSRARTGAGELVIRTDRAPEFNIPARAIVIDFDNNGGQTDIHIALDGLVVAGVEERNPLEYDFHRTDDGDGALHFAVVGEIADGPRLERLNIDALWDVDQSGRAEGSVSGGDIPDGVAATETQCWDVRGANTYVKGDVPPDQHFEDPAGGDPDQLCAYTQAEFDAAIDALRE